MIIFITGATGFIGSHFLKQLLENLGPSDCIYTLDRNPKSSLDRRVISLPGDLRDIENHKAVLTKANWIFHIAANATFGSGQDYTEINVRPVAKIIDAVKNSDQLIRFVLVSSVGALDRAKADKLGEPLAPNSEPNPTSDYGRSKLKAERIVIESKLPFTIIRPGWVYGSGMRPESHLNKFGRMVSKKTLFTRLDPPGRVPLIHVQDLAAAFVRCLDEPRSLNATYIATTENRTIGDVFACLHQSIYNQPIPPRIPLPRLSFIFNNIHGFLPLALTNLFVDYLAAEDLAFRRDLLVTQPIKIEEGIKDIASAYSEESGWWLVTGANSGIGLALVEALRDEDVAVIAIDRAIDNLNPAKRLKVVELDITDSTKLASFTEDIKDLKLAALVNNAGVGFRGGLLDQPWRIAEQMIRVNIVGTIELTHLLRNQLLRDGTTIVNIASSVAYYPLPHMSIYAATKSFLLNWSLALSEELHKTNSVVTFSPSGTNTNFQKTGGVKGAGNASLYSPSFVAKNIINAARKRRTHRILGFKAKVLELVVRFLPVRARVKLLSHLFRSSR